MFALFIPIGVTPLLWTQRDEGAIILKILKGEQ